ncbi:hypothetical protein RV18_GL002894 [Enterococcus termitis]|nr:hypothetical protein RV18_GL002894 [Enterococcus termitis]
MYQKKGSKKMLLTENKQPVKEISHQDIYAVYYVLEKIQSWQ